MRMPSLFRSKWVVAGFCVTLLLVIGFKLIRWNPPPGNDGKASTVDELIHQLHARLESGNDQRLSDLFGPFRDSDSPVQKLIDLGDTIQPRLLEELKDTRIRNEIAIVLSRLGNKDAIPYLIELLPAKKNSTEEEKLATECLLIALCRITGMNIGHFDKFPVEYSPEFKAEWTAWYDANKNYLYTPPLSMQKSLFSTRALVDGEAKLSSRTSEVYRQEHPWIDFDEVKEWRDDPAYERKLKAFCFSVLLNNTWNAYGPSTRDGIRALGRLSDPLALTALHTFCSQERDLDDCRDLVRTLGDRGDPLSKPVIEQIPKSSVERPDWDSNEAIRERALERIRLLQKYGHELKGKSFDEEQQTDYMRCLDSPKGVDQLIEYLKNRKYDVFLSRYLLVAGYVDHESVRSYLKKMVEDETRDERARTLVQGALARLSVKGSLDSLKQLLSHRHPGVRLAAAEGLWQMGSREGLKTLIELLEVRPIETGGEGVSVHEGGFKVTALRGANVEYIRSACAILGEMGDRSAIEPLKRLLSQNLNGVSGGGGGGWGGTGWPGRPDVVALAKLGDFSGIDVLRKSIQNGDPLNVSSHHHGYIAIGLKRFIPDLLPLFADWHQDKRIQAAEAILILMERGK
jgi:HEAT repeat protein